MTDEKALQKHEVLSMPIKAKKRVHAKPQVNIQQDFVVQTPGHLIDIAIANKLTSVEWSLWMYLMRVNPFADFTSDGEPIYREIPGPSELAIILGRDRKTIERAGRRLSELGLYKLRAKSWEGFNETAVESKKLLQQRKNKSTSSDNTSKNRASLQGTKKSLPELNSAELELNSSEPELNSAELELNNSKQELESLLQKDSITPQTIQTSSDSLESEEEESNKPPLEEAAIAQEKQEEQEEEIVSKEELIDSALASIQVLGYEPTIAQKECLIQMSPSQIKVALQRFHEAMNNKHVSATKNQRFDYALRLARYSRG